MSGSSLTAHQPPWSHAAPNLSPRLDSGSVLYLALPPRVQFLPDRRDQGQLSDPGQSQVFWLLELNHRSLAKPKCFFPPTSLSAAGRTLEG